MQIAHLPMTQFWSTDSALRKRPSPLGRGNHSKATYTNPTNTCHQITTPTNTTSTLQTVNQPKVISIHQQQQKFHFFKTIDSNFKTNTYEQLQDSTRNHTSQDHTLQHSTTNDHHYFQDHHTNTRISLQDHTNSINRH